MAGRRAVAGPGSSVGRGRRGPRTLVLDSEGLSAGAAGDPRVRQFLERAWAADAAVVVSAITLAETLRGRPADAPVHRLLTDVTVTAVSARIAADAGALLGRTGRRDTVDAVVAVTAADADGPVVLLTSDPTDLTALTESWPQITVARV